MLSVSCVYCDLDGRNKGIANSGTGVIHQLAGNPGLMNKTDTRPKLLKRHLAYHESGHFGVELLCTRILLLNLPFNLFSNYIEYKTLFVNKKNRKRNQFANIAYSIRFCDHCFGTSNQF